MSAKHNGKHLEGKRVRFGKERAQPTGKAKSEGWAKRREDNLYKLKSMELAKAVLQLAFKGANNSEIKKLASDYFGIAEKDITVEMMLLFRQAEKAIQKADTQAFNAIMQRAFGLPKQEVEHSGEITTIKIVRE